MILITEKLFISRSSSEHLFVAIVFFPFVGLKISLFIVPPSNYVSTRKYFVVFVNPNRQYSISLNFWTSFFYFFKSITIRNTFNIFLIYSTLFSGIYYSWPLCFCFSHFPSAWLASLYYICEFLGKSGKFIIIIKYGLILELTTSSRRRCALTFSITLFSRTVLVWYCVYLL